MNPPTSQPGFFRSARRFRWAFLCGLVLSIGLTAVSPASRTPFTASFEPARPCVSLTELTFADGTRVTGAEEEDGICRVRLTVPESITVAVSLPVYDWNGRFQGVGGGGYVGALTPPDSAAEAGYAAASTDTGHTASALSGAWAWSPTGMRQNLVTDFARRSLHEMTVKGKAVTEAYYGQAPAYSYWNGCSTGGRQGLMEAQRHPEDYDGILSAAPAVNWDRFVPAALWPQIVMRESGRVISPCVFEALGRAVVAACDGNDGVRDGIVDPLACRFDPSRLIGMKTACGTVTAEDAAVVEKIWQGPRGQDGSFLWYGLTPGASFIGLAGSNSTGAATPFPIAADWFRYWLAKDPDFDWRTVGTADFADWFEQSRAEYHDILGTDDPDLGAFRDGGGKLILWHGWADELIFPQGTIDYFRRVAAESGGPQRTERFARLFMAPGVAHCNLGPGAAPVDPLAALVAWVEKGEAPETLLGRNGDLTRPLCRWPAVPRYTGHGNTDDAANFRCAATYGHREE
ncbi:tannase/feruloyl esterase family alpha/beta hydrolase [Streptomyces sp. ME02-8801-2C]|uniref:tannase/feruloyl esterase family alpha/beta hydrolase n=1 Tax=Streptomyces sp. ME02-8801-2C TaxID=3028680 RepID=UPI0029AD7186|nr:tannase/feruloyl esterase family alpha/beta hydrolase [Streptomyces sp. ME02-8801-2C]MDX3453570.1 tannase/feruloyl esterase family alpha/beta hydrolase [Streptomyces sp. ME02-8801-2C]